MESEFERSRCDLFVFLRADNVFAMMTVLCWYHLSFIVIIITIIIGLFSRLQSGLLTSLSLFILQCTSAETTAFT